MPVDPSQSENLYKLSIRKYFVDQLETTRGIRVYFDKEYSIPRVNGIELTSWVLFGFGRTILDTLSSNVLNIYCFSRKDPDGVYLSVLRDSVMDTLLDNNQTDGRKRIPYLNDSHSVVGGIVPHLLEESGIEVTPDGSNVKTVTVRMLWGSK